MVRVVALISSLWAAGYANAQVIRTDTTWSGLVSVSRDVTVTDGAVLRIAEGTVVEFGYDDTIFVRDGARVVADGAVFRPTSTLGNSAAIYVHEVKSPGSVELRNSTLEHVFVYTTGSGVNVFESNRFEGEANLRLFSTAGAVVRSNTFESARPIWTEITQPGSLVEGNRFASGSIALHPNSQRITSDDTVRTWQGLPVQFEGDVWLTSGATLVIRPGTELRFGYFDAIIVNGYGVVKAEGVRFRPAGSPADFPALIVSQGDGPGRAELSDCVVQSVSIQFSGGTGFVTGSDFLVSPGRTALTNSAAEPVDARGNYWNGAQGPKHSTNPQGDGASVSGPVDYAPWQASALHSIATDTEPAFAAGAPALEDVYPNPSPVEARIGFTVERGEFVTIELYDVTGRIVETLASGYHPPGKHALAFRTAHLAGGMYLLRMQAGEIVHAKQLVVSR